ncbi:MAG: AAA family ATPase, partial [Muribaculaceae bacterium]|nr:AAA family ATPase [Muribaculaceae bacterium]
MMNPEILKNIIIEGQEILRMVSPVSRNFEFEPHARYVFVGVRQCGKSYLMYIRALQLIKEGHDIREMVFINFDDERLIGYKASELDDILKAYSSLFDYRPILFLDEIQNVEGWEHFARRMSNQKY